jgi:hypothetical protein
LNDSKDRPGEARSRSQKRSWNVGLGHEQLREARRPVVGEVAAFGEATEAKIAILRSPFKVRNPVVWAARRRRAGAKAGNYDLVVILGRSCGVPSAVVWRSGPTWNGL